MNKRSISCAACITIMLVGYANSFLHAKDTLIMKGNKNYEGTFQGYKNDNFYFQPNNGKTIKTLRSFAEKLVLDPPALVTIVQRGKKKVEDLKLKSYEKSIFLFDNNGSEVSMPGMQISAIEMGLDFRRAAGGTGGQEDGQDTENTPLKINLTDLAALVKESNSTPEQTKAFERYRAARNTYDSFLETSSAMVKSMDKATGAAREDFLNKLRKRKNDEQPLLGELKKAEQELLTALPQIKVTAPAR